MDGAARAHERSRASGPPVVSVVIPAKNEARNIGWVLRRLPDVVDEVIVVDGLSEDDTLAIAAALRPDVRLVHELRPGKGAALRAGFAAARGEYVVMIDADGSMDPGEIEQYLVPLRAGYEFVKGSRFMRGGRSDDITPLRLVGNKGLCLVVNLLFMARFTDLCYGFCAFRRSALPKLALRSDGFEVETEMVVNAAKARLRIAEVPTYERNRRFGQSNLRTVRDGLRVLRTLLVARFGAWQGNELCLGAPQEQAALVRAQPLASPASMPPSLVIDLREPPSVVADALVSAAGRP